VCGFYKIEFKICADAAPSPGAEERHPPGAGSKGRAESSPAVDATQEARGELFDLLQGNNKEGLQKGQEVGEGGYYLHV